MPVLSKGESPGQDGLAVRIVGLSKTYPGTRALENVDLDIRKGEVHALCGGNGSGKSTLIKIVCGVVTGDGGSVTIGERTLDVAEIHPSVVHSLGIRVVHQDLAVFPDLSVAENMSLIGDMPTRAALGINWNTVTRRANELIERFEIDARPSDLMRDLPIATRAQVAIARALQDVEAGSGLIILDEPTAALPVHEATVLHNAIRQLGRQGHAVLFVSHRLDEVLALTDRVTVLRDGRAVSAHDTARLSEQELIEAILGRRAAATRERRSQVDEGPIVLEISRLTAGPLRDVSLMIRAGEVVGIAGLLGSGRSELLRAVYGDLSREAGTIAVNGKPAHFQRKDQAIGRGVVMIPEDRAAGGIFADLSVAENLNASVLRRYWRLLFRTRKLRRDSADLIARFAIKTPTDSVPIAALSGGNQQKTVFARWLRRDPVLLLLDEPAQGVDVGARADIYAAVREVTDAGGAALVVASDLEELAQVVDRALVLRNGAITAEVQLADLSAQRLNELIYEGGRDVWSGPSAERP